MFLPKRHTHEGCAAPRHTYASPVAASPSSAYRTDHVTGIGDKVPSLLDSAICNSHIHRFVTTCACISPSLGGSLQTAGSRLVISDSQLLLTAVNLTFRNPKWRRSFPRCSKTAQYRS